MIILGQKYQHPSGNTNLCRQACSLGTDRIFDHLNGQDLAFKHLLFNGNLRLRIADQARRLSIRLPVPHIGNMQKRRTLQSNVNECRLHARENSSYLAQIDVAHQAPLQSPFDV